MHDASWRFNGFRLITATRELWKGDVRMPVPARVFSCLRYLIEHRDRIVGRDELIEAVWHRDNVSDIQLGQLILRARRAVDDGGSAQHSIRTAVGFGYHWIAPTELESEPIGASQHSAIADESVLDGDAIVEQPIVIAVEPPAVAARGALTAHAPLLVAIAPC